MPIKHIFATSVGPWLKYGVTGWHLYCQRFWNKRWSPTGVGSCIICATHGQPHCASECGRSGRRFWRNGSWWLCCFFFGILKAMKAKVLLECEGRRLLQFGWGLPVYLFTSVHGWEGASCIWLQHVLASSNRPLCILSLEADTQHVVHKLWLEGLAIACCWGTFKRFIISSAWPIGASCQKIRLPGTSTYFLHFWILSSAEQDAACKVHTKSKCIGNAARLTYGMDGRLGDPSLSIFLWFQHI